MIQTIVIKALINCEWKKQRIIAKGISEQKQKTKKRKRKKIEKEQQEKEETFAVSILTL